MKKGVCRLKQMTAIVLALLMVVSYLPNLSVIAQAATEDSPVSVSSAEEFQAMQAGGSYILTQDIQVTEPYASEFTGTFDGDGHTVTLDISGTNSNQALFANLGSAGVIKNVITDGKVSGETTVAGIAAVSTGTIEQCLNQAEIQATGNNAAGIVGNPTAGTIKNCGNLGAVSATGTSSRWTGGIAGNSKADITNCYNQGKISTARTSRVYIGGIVGNQSGGTLGNSYNTGTIVTESANNLGAIAGWAYGVTVSSPCYYLEGSCTTGVSTTDTEIPDKIISKNEAYMKSGNFVSDLGEAFVAKTGDYPVLSWQKQESAAAASVSFQMTQEDAVLVIKDADQKTVHSSKSGSERTCSLPAGSYTWEVSKEGYLSQNGSFTITQEQADSGASLDTKEISLELDTSAWSVLSFKVSGTSDYQIVLKNGEEEVSTETDGSYKVLKEKEYTYTVTAEGYETVTGNVKPAEDQQTVEVTLTAVEVKEFPSTVFDSLSGKAKVEYSHNDNYTGDEEFVDEEEGILRSNNKGQASSRVNLVLTISEGVEPSLLSFDYKVSSEPYGDGLSINNGSKIMGVVDWTTYTQEVKAGDTITLSYVKDSYGDKNDDCVYFRNFKIEDLQEVSFTVSPSDASLTLMKKGDSNAIKAASSSDGKYTYHLTDGEYSYTASSFGYEEKTGDIKVEGKALDQEITLTKQPVQKVSFAVTTPDGITGEPVIEVKNGDKVIAAESDGSYALPAGEYTYTVTLTNCETETGKFTVSDKEQTVTVILLKKLLFEDFFSHMTEQVTAENDTSYAFDAKKEAGVSYLQSSNTSSYSTSTITLTFNKASRLSFDYMVSEDGYSYSTTANYGLIINKNGTQIEKITEVSKEWKSYTISGKAGDKVTLQYKCYKNNWNAEDEDWVRLKDFTVKAVTPVTFEGLSDNAVLTVKKGDEVQKAEDGVYLLEPGEYTYDVTVFGYQEIKDRKLTVGEEEQTEKVELEALPQNKVVFQVKPDSAQNISIKVTNSEGEDMKEFASEDGSFSLPTNESYRYTVSADNYVPKSGSFTLKEDSEIAVTLEDKGEAWDGNAATDAPELKDGAYQIQDAADLAWFRDQVNTDSHVDYNAVLTANINLNDKDWTGIGTYEYPNENYYAGTFDGKGHTISGLKGSSGLFAYAGAEAVIKNVKLVVDLSGSGTLGGVVNTLYGSVTNCQVEGTINATTTYGVLAIGGIVGRMPNSDTSKASVKNCANKADVKNTCTSYSTDLNTGGIVGYTYGEIINCYNTGDISAREDRSTNKNIAGLAGRIYKDAVVENCYSVGKVTGPENGKASFAGTNAGTIRSVYVLKGIADKTILTNTGSGTVTEKTKEEFKDPKFVYEINGEGDAYLQDDGMNSGYPVLSWQGGKDPEVSNDWKNVMLAKRNLTIKDESGETISANSDGEYHFYKNENLTLDQTQNDCNVTWKSSDASSVSDKGAIQIPSEGKTEVVLTAEITSGEEKAQVEFKLVLWSVKAQNLEKLNNIKEGLEKTSTYIEPMQAYDQTNIAQTLEQYLSRKGYDEDNIQVSFVSPGTKSIPGGDTTENLKEDGTIVYFTGSTQGESYSYAQYRDVEFKLSLDGQEVTVKVRVHIGWDEKTVQNKIDTAISESLTWDAIKGENTSTATVSKENEADWWDTVTVQDPISEDLSLPTALSGGYSVTWGVKDSSAMSVTSNSDGSYTAHLNRPDKGEDPITFTLYATVKYNNIDDYMKEEMSYEEKETDWLTGSRHFVITIAPETDDQSSAMQAALEEKYEGLLRDFVNKEQTVDVTAIKADLQLPRTQTLEDAGILTRGEQNVKVESSNTDVMDVSGYHAYIYRPLPGEDPVTVTYTVKIHKLKDESKVYAQKTFQLTVMPMEQEEIDAAKAFMEKAATEETYWEGIKGENAEKGSVTKDLTPFIEILQNDDGSFNYVRGTANLTFGGIEIDEIPGYNAFLNDTWRIYRTTKPTVIKYENLLVTQPEYNTKVRIDSVMTYSIYGKYWEKFKGTDKEKKYTQFQQFYKQPVSTEVTVTGTTGQDNPNPDPDSIEVKVAIKGKGNKGFKDLETVKVDKLSYDTATAWDAVKKALEENNYTYNAIGSYLSSVTDPAGVTLSDQDDANSGWIYKVNGTAPDVYMGSYYLKDGDIIELSYVADYTKDTENVSENTGEFAAKMEGNTATAEISASEFAALVIDTIDKDATNINVRITGTEDADKIVVTIPKEELYDIGYSTRGLSIETSAGKITLNSAAVSAIVQKANTDTISFIFEKKANTSAQEALLGNDMTVTDISVMAGDQKITDFGEEGTVKIAIPLSDNLKADNTGLAYLDADGKLVQLEGEIVTINGKQYYAVSDYGRELILAKESSIEEAIKKQKEDSKEDSSKKETKKDTVSPKVRATTLKGKASGSKNSILLKVTKKGYAVSAYQIFRSTSKNGKYVKIAETKKSSYRDKKKIRKTKKYYYKIRGYRKVNGKVVYTKWSNIFKGRTDTNKEVRLKNKLKKTTVRAAAKKKNKVTVLSWKKNGPKVSGYEIYRSKKKSSGYVKTAKTKKVSWKDKKNTGKQRKYYYKVRGYRVVNGTTIYTRWSKIVR